MWSGPVSYRCNSELIGLCNSNGQPASFPRLSPAVPMLPKDIFHTQPPRRHLNWEASMSASPDGWISHIWSMPVFMSRGNSYSYLRLEIRGWTGLANPLRKGWRSATDSRLLFTGPACTQTKSQTFTTRGDSQRPVHLSLTSVDWNLNVPVRAQFPHCRLRRCTKSDVNMCIYKHKLCFTDISGNCIWSHYFLEVCLHLSSP